MDPRKCKKPTIIVIAKPWEKLYGNLYERGLKAVTVAVRRNPYDALPQT